jgi:hypothetical protein
MQPKEIDFDKILFRCSSWGDLMAEPKTKAAKDAGELSETAKALCIRTWFENKYKISDELTSKYLEKGIVKEEDSITLLSKIDKTFYRNNKARFSNEYISGEYDIIHNGHIIDIKTSWDAYSFFKHLKETDLDRKYYYQLQGYMALTHSNTAEIAYCLVDTPEEIIEKEVVSYWYKSGQPNTDNEMWMETEKEIRNRMIFSDKIAPEDRVIRIRTERNDSDIQLGYSKIESARQWMKENLRG